MADTLMLLSGGHPVHKRFGEAVGAEMFQLPVLAAKSQPAPLKGLNLLKAALSVPSGHDYLLCESAYFYPALKRRLFLLGKSKIINLNCGPILHHVLSGRVRGLEARLLLSLLKEVDGHLVYGTFGAALMKKLKVEKPVRIVYPFISDGSFKRLSSVTPALDSNRICIIATSDAKNKGFDLLFRALARVREAHPGASLDIITRISDVEISSMGSYAPGSVRILRGVADIASALASAALYVQPSRSDMFPVACLEAMAAGLPCIVSDENGASEVMKKIDGQMVVPCDTGALASAITKYLDSSKKERASLSQRSREAAAFFTEQNALDIFKKQFEALKKEI